MLLLQLEKGMDESGQGPSHLQIQNSEGCHNWQSKISAGIYVVTRFRLENPS